MQEEEIEKTLETIICTLACYDIDTDIHGVEVGPAVTRYDLVIANNVPAQMALNCSADIAIRLKQRDGIRMYENAESGAISVEIPNSIRSTVSLTVGKRVVQLKPEGFFPNEGDN